MAVTLTQQPQTYMPGANQCVWVGLSNQTAQPNFSYTVKITDLVSSVFQIYTVAPHPVTGECIFDSHPWSEKFIPQYMPINVYGWQQSTAIRRIRVNIGETYGSTPAYTAGADVNYIIWNSYVDYLEYPGYDMDNYVFNGTTDQGFKYLSGLLNGKTYANKSDYLFILTSQAGDVLNLRVETYNAAGVNIGTSDIANPYQAATAYDDKYLCIDIGHKGLSNILTGQVTGTFPIITASVAYYEVFEVTISVTPAQSNLNFLKRLEIGCEPRFDIYTVHYLRKSGAMEVIHFSKRSDREFRVDEESYGKNPNVLSSGTYGYTIDTGVSHTLSSITTERLKLQTDFLSSAEFELHKEIIDSPLIYLDLDPGYPYPKLKRLTSSFKTNARFHGISNIQMDFEYSHENHRQRV